MVECHSVIIVTLFTLFSFFSLDFVDKYIRLCVVVMDDDSFIAFR
jgi:hypothetical protein